MSTARDELVEQIGGLADRAHREEEECKRLRRQRDFLAEELEKLATATLKISRSPRLRAQAENAQEVVAATTQESSG